MLDYTSQIDDVARSVGTVPLELGEARTITLQQTLPVSAPWLWRACTTAEGIGSWYRPVTGDLELNGAYQLDGGATGQVTTCDPGRQFTATWIFGFDSSTLDVTFEPVTDASTRLTVEHDVEFDDRMWEAYGPAGAGIGWDLTLMSLATFIATGQAVTPEDNLAWARSADGTNFAELSAKAWAQAAIESGVKPKQAREAAARARENYRFIEQIDE
jgi:uncharacterized protein YndB with AHSA1/START domain